MARRFIVRRGGYRGKPSIARRFGSRGNIRRMELLVNGDLRRLDPAPATVADLVHALALTGKRIAVERNGEIVPKGLHAGTQLVDGDRLEIVVAVGGG